VKPTTAKPLVSRVRTDLYGSPHYYLWTDALQAQSLARAATNKWNRGTYVRWALNTAWAAFEMACGEALEGPGLGNRFKVILNAAIDAKGLPALDWGQGLWQKVGDVYKARIKYVHVNAKIDQADLFAPVEEADKAITTLQEGIKAIYIHAGKVIPAWANLTAENGLHNSSASAHLTVIRAGVKQDDPDAIKLTYISQGEEYTSEVYPPGTDPEPLIEDLLYRIIVPISAIRVYRGDELWIEEQLPMRGT
jgi:hypothetical protein